MKLFRILLTLFLFINIAFADDDVGYVSFGSERYKILNGIISASSSGNNELVAAQSGKRIMLLSYSFMCSAAVNAKFRSASTDTTGLHYCGAVGGGISAPFDKGGYTTTAIGEALNINLSGAVAIGGRFNYVILPY